MTFKTLVLLSTHITGHLLEDMMTTVGYRIPMKTRFEVLTIVYITLVTVV